MAKQDAPDRASEGETQIRARGVLIAAAVGDALGWPQEQRSGIVGGDQARNVKPRLEFRSWSRHAGTRFNRYEELVTAGSYSDDTQLLLAVARAAAQHSDHWHDWLRDVEMPAWPIYQRGGGGAVLSAARGLQRGRLPWENPKPAKTGPPRYFTAGANGVAMRIAPHAVATSRYQDGARLGERVINDGILTHGHPRAIVGGLLHAQALDRCLRHHGTVGYGEMLSWLLDDPAWADLSLLDHLPESWRRSHREHVGDSLEGVWRQTIDEARELLDTAAAGLARGAVANDEETLSELGCFDKRINGAGTVTAVAALYVAARNAPKPERGLLRAAFLPRADTDTLASMTGSLLGGLYGADWLGGLAGEVQDSSYISRMADELMGGPTGGDLGGLQLELAPTPRAVGHGDDRRLQTTLEHMHRGTTGEFLDGRAFELRDRGDLKAKANASVTRFELAFKDGQSAVVDVIRKRSQSSHASKSAPSATQRGSSQIGGVTLLVTDLGQSANFYSQVLGVAVKGSGGGYVEVGASLRLEAAGAIGPTSGVRVDLFVPSMSAIRRRMDDAGVAYRAGTASTEVRDPDGNLVTIREMNQP